MKQDEEFVMTCLVNHLGGSFHDGEDPPDGYLLLEDKKIAVEVSRLIQQVEDKDGNQTPRIALDKPPLLIIEELNKNLINQIPENKYIFLILQAPINDVRNTKKKLASLILNQLHSGIEHQDLEISENKITIKIYSGQRGEKKVIGAVTNNTPNKNLLCNAAIILADRIEAKEKACTPSNFEGEYWLALLNDYWIADFDIYKAAYKRLKLNHGFEKIIIVNYDGDIACI